MTEWVSAGKVRMTPKGTHDPTSTYHILDLVSNTEQNIYYIAKQDVPANVQVTNTTYWGIVVDMSGCLPDFLESIAPNYEDMTFPIEKGTLVVYTQKLYVANSDISTSEEWDSTHWNETTVADELESMVADVGDLKSEIDEIEDEFVITKVPTGEKTLLVDNGRYAKSSEYAQYHKLNANTGAYEEEAGLSGWWTSETYYEIPDGALIFNYLENQGITSVGHNYCFYDANKEYLGRSTFFQVTSSNVHDDTWNNLLGKFVTIPTGAKYYRLWVGSDDRPHSDVLVTAYDSSVNIPNLALDADLTQPAQPAQGKAVGDAINALSDEISGLGDRVDDVEEIATDLNGQIEISKQVLPYEPVADYGRYQDGVAYSDYVSSHQLNVDTGAYIDASPSGWRASEEYYEIPDGALLFNYLVNQSVTSISKNYCFYASDKTYLGRSTWVNVTTKTDEWNGLYGKFVPIPNNAKYFRVWDADGSVFHSALLVQGEKVSVIIPNLNTNFDNIKPIQGLQILALGDSIWGNDRTNGISDFLAEYSGATIYNGAVGGTRITGDRDQYSAPAYKPFDGVNLIHALITQTWTEQDAEVDNVTAYVKTETLPMLKQLDMSTIDVIVLAYGHNDFTAPKSISAIQSAFNAAVSEILTAYPSIRILIIAPPWRMFSSSTVDGDVYENGNNDTLRDISDSIVDAANNMHITSINMLNELPWRAETKSYYLDSDFVHPNTNGNRIYAHAVYGKLRSMY